LNRVLRPRTLPFGLLLLLALAAGFAAEELRCAICGEMITGRYIEESGQAYHESCYAEHRAPHCAVCGKPIMGPRIETEGKSYHESCYREAKQPRCAACGGPIEGTYLIVDGKSYHPACHRGRALRCVVCGEPLEGSYVEDGWGNAFHARHGRDLLCPFCGRVMAAETTGGGFISTANGIRICAFCARRAVSRPEEVEEILERARRRLVEIFPVPPGSYTWELVDKRGLLQRLPPGQSFGNELGMTRGDLQGSGRMVTRRINVILLSGIPDWLLEAVAGHELAHVWQQLQGLDSLPHDQAEGTAEYAAYLLLKDGGTQEGRVKIEAMEKSRDGVYGSGFRRALRAAESDPSPARLREILQKGRGWPSNP
jgi:hypothetical protein